MRLRVLGHCLCWFCFSGRWHTPTQNRGNIELGQVRKGKDEGQVLKNQNGRAATFKTRVATAVTLVLEKRALRCWDALLVNYIGELKLEPKPHLQLPRISNGACDGTNLSISNIRVRQPELRMVEHIKSLSAEFKAYLIANYEILEQRHIPVHATRSEQAVTRRIAVGKRCRRGISTWIEPALERARIVDRAHLVWPASGAVGG